MDIMVAWAARKARTLLPCLWGAFMMLGTVIVAPGASAVPLTFVYEGTMTTQTVGLPSLVGESIRVEYTFESMTTDLSPSDSNLGNYQNALTSLTVTIGMDSWTFSNGGAGFGAILIDVSGTGGTIKTYQVATSLGSPSVTGPLLNGRTVTILQIALQGGSTIPASDDSLPSRPPTPALFSGFQGILLSTNNGDVVAEGSSSSPITARTVSAPAGTPLVLAGVAALGFVQRRRQRKQIK